MIFSPPSAGSVPRAPARLGDRQLRELSALLGEEGLRTDETSRERYGRDETEDHCFPPAAVALPASTDEVSALLAWAHREGLPTTPRGAGTGLSGGALPVAGGLALSLERLDRIRAVDPGDLVAEVEAGVVLARLQDRLAEQGLFYPPDPASRDTCTLGGNLAEDSAGPRSCKYGSTRRWVLGLEAVLADGTVIETGGRNRKDVTGYNLTQLLVGSEGTLAVLTAATLRLTALPAATLTLALPFPDLEPAARAISALFVEGFDPAACELLAAEALEAVGKELPLPPALDGCGALILLELHASGGGVSEGATDGSSGEEDGSAEALLEQALGLEALGRRHGGGEALVARSASDQRRLWQIRRQVGHAVKHGSIYKEADSVVPRSRLAELVRASRRVAEEHGLRAVCYGHAGDGNLHINLLRGDLPPEAWEARRDAAEAALFEEVLALGGAITGEHGVGWTQRRYLERALGRDQVALMGRIKAAFDPKGLLNPEKIFP